MADRSAKREQESEMGAGGREFPVTSWGLIAGMQNSVTLTRRQALESLCQRYWKPVYHYVRRAWSKSTEDAKDLTQAFFVRLLEDEKLLNYKPERGGFRVYLKVLLRGFAADQHDALTALKRGGGVKLIALEGSPGTLQDALADPRAEDPEQLFDWAWKRDVLERSVERARHWFATAGRTAQFRAFEAYELAAADRRPTYAEVAAALKVSESDVRNYLFAVRERLRAEIRAELAQTVTNAQQLEEEWSDLFGG